MPDLVGLLRRLADEYEQAERQEKDGEASQALEARLEALEQRDGRSLREAFEELSEEDKATLREALGHTPAPTKPRAMREAPTPPPAQEEEEEKPKAKRTRPGRQRGKPYWYRTDDEGRVVESAIPVIYNGEDEPDEVDLPDEPEAAGDEAKGEAA